MAIARQGWSVAAVVGVLLLASASIVRSDDGPSDVVTLTPDTFDDFVGKDQYALVKFYAPWCGHCKKLAPDWEVVATAFKKVPSVVIAKVDCDSHKDLCSRFSVSGYPTLNFFSRDSLTPSDYKGGRSADDLIEYVNREAGTNAKVSRPPSNVVVLTPSNFDAIVKDSSKHVLVEFYAPWCGHCKNLVPIYEKVANVYAAESNIVIAKCDADAHKSLAEKYGVSGFPTIKWFSQENKDGEDYSGGRALDDFVAFVNDKTGSKRNVHGGLTADAGVVAELEEYVKSFKDASLEAKEGIIQKAQEAVEKLSGSNAYYGGIYLKIFKAALKKGAEYPVKEAERVARILKSNSVTPAKETELTYKKNILSTFFN